MSFADGFLMTKISTRLKCEVVLSLKSLVLVHRVFICGIYVVVCGYKNIGEYVCMFRCGYIGITLWVWVWVRVQKKTVNPLDSKYIY